MNGNIIVKNASEVVTCSGFSAKKGAEMNDLHIIKNGTVVIKNGNVEAVGNNETVLHGLNTNDFSIIDACGNSVIPGFVDSHTHFVFGGYRADEFSWRLRGDSYMEIMERGGGIASSVKSTREATRDNLIKSGRKRLDSMISFGVTTVEGKSGYGLDLDTEIKQLEVMKELNKSHPLDIVQTFLGPHSLPAEYKNRSNEFIDFMTDTVLPVVIKKDLAEFCDIFCEKNVFSVNQSRKFFKACKAVGLKIKIHADEIVQLGGSELAAEVGAVSADHLLQASDEGIRMMAENNVVATLLPGTAFSLKEHYANGRKMIDMGCAVALATDMNPGSCYTESIPLIIALSTLYMNLTTEETLTALTINGAAALDRADRVGSIDVGKKGDLLILKYPSYKFLPYHMGINAVEKVIKNGNVII